MSNQEVKPISFTLDGVELTFPHPTELSYKNFRLFKQVVTGLPSPEKTQELISSGQEATLLKHLGIMDDFIDGLMEESPVFAVQTKHFTVNQMTKVVMYYMGFTDPQVTEDKIQKVIDSLKK